MDDQEFFLITNTGSVKRVSWLKFARHAPALALVDAFTYADILRDTKAAEQKMEVARLCQNIRTRQVEA